MSRRNLSTCATHGCPELTLDRHCPDHKPTPWATTNRDTGTRIGGRAWQKTRARILRRDPTCQHCGAAPATEVDHIVGRIHFTNQHVADQPTNLQGLCTACHHTKTAREAADARHQRTTTC